MPSLWPGFAKWNFVTVKLNSLSPCVHALIICAVWNVNATDLASTSKKHSFHVSQNAAWRKIALQWMRIKPGHRSGSHRACARHSGLAEVPVRIRGGGGSLFFTSRQASKPRGSWALRIIANCGHLGSSLLFALGLSQLKETRRAEPRNAGKSVSLGSSGLLSISSGGHLHLTPRDGSSATAWDVGGGVPGYQHWTPPYQHSTPFFYCYSSPCSMPLALCGTACQALTWTVLSVKTQGLNLMCFSVFVAFSKGFAFSS